jgi:hypothetical protein
LMILAFIQQALGKISLLRVGLSLMELRAETTLRRRKKQSMMTRSTRDLLSYPQLKESKTDDTNHGTVVIVTISRKKLPKEVTVTITQTWE